MRRAGGWRAHALGLGLIGVLLLPRASAAQYSPRHWSTSNIILAGAYVGAVWIDLAQTRYFLRDPKWEESNPILGKRPSPLKVDLLGLAGVGVMLGLAHVVKDPWRSVLLAVGTGIELRVIAFNSTGGVGIRLY